MQTIAWDDIEFADRPGQYYVPRLGITVGVKQIHIDNWKSDPKGVCTVVGISTSDGDRYALGSFHPSDL